MSLIRLTQLFYAALLTGLVSTASATATVQIELGAAATGKDWYQMALWLEDPQGRYQQTFYVTASVGREGLGNGFSRIFGLTLREIPESLPVWAHRRGVRYGESYYPPREEPLPDTVTGATIKQPYIDRTFALQESVVQGLDSEPWKCLLELNVSRDGAPSMVFQADTTVNQGLAPFRFIGYGHHQGLDGGLYVEQADPLQFVRKAGCAIFDREDVPLSNP